MLNKWFLFLLSISLFSCHKKQVEKDKTTLYLTTSANDVYAFNIAEKKMLWHVKALHTEENDEVNYFTIDDKNMTKIYLDGAIRQYNKTNGNVVWEMKDSISADADLYNYDFNNVVHRLFYQYPLVANGNIIFGNSHGEIKSINLKTKKINWIYYNPNTIYSSPKIAGNLVFINLNGSLISLDIKSGKKTSSVNYEENEPVTNEIFIENDKIFTLSQYNLLSCMTTKYDLVWDYKAPTTSQSSTHNMLITDDAVYFGGSTLYAINKKKGDLLWKTELYKDDNTLLSVAQCNDGVVVSTRKELLKIDDNGKIIIRKKLINEAFGLLYQCNNRYYYVCQNGILYSIDADLKNEKVFYKGININPEHRVDNTYMLAE